MGHKYTPMIRASIPWINSDVSKIIRAKSDYFRLYKMGMVTKNENNTFKNKVKSIISKLKFIYYKKIYIIEIDKI